ncbi:DUF3810 domain-containing protein [Pedobacter montanisoli]|uniref:DUF3810 domain-containing protein n=1 Tax=Pedobacter montanisoli TaxID=2923277 RepID=A0ABS9ZW62_9SPHI|nr:DUF3810 domain-containing protein [Pedobacter montanisoli]MCJ0742550.1 DUF3810 domain-containing protein [Pedobacter montanisoli]
MDKAGKAGIKKFAILLFVAFLVFLWGLNEIWVEKWFSNGLYPLIALFQRSVSSLFPFAIGDFLYAILIVLICWKTFSFFRKRPFNRDLWKILLISLLNLGLGLYIAFKLLWGLNYNRPQIHTQLQIGNQLYDKKQLLKLADFFLNKINNLQAQLDQQKDKPLYTKTQLFNETKAAYDQLAKHQSFFKYKIASIKPAISGWLTSKMGIEGYYNPLSGEANVNMLIPNFVLPYVTCHEVAHQISVSKEDEANLVGYLTSIHSNDLYFQYSGYYNMLRSILFEIMLKYPDQYLAYREKLPEELLAKFKIERDFWVKYNGQMSAYMSKTFDQLLKLNNQRKGIDSYQDIVLWLYNYHKHEL